MAFSRRTVFEGISFDVESGEVLSITGPNGSGKSTVSKIICGLLTPTSGEIAIMKDGMKIERDDIHKHVGFVAPYLELYGEFTALENLQLEARARGLKLDKGEEPQEILSLVGLFSRRNDEVRSFSSGMKQRLKYAAALIHDPGLVVLDEPTANLDAAGNGMVFELVEKLRKEKIVVLATNDEQEAALGDVRVVLQKDLRSGNTG